MMSLIRRSLSIIWGDLYRNASNLHVSICRFPDFLSFIHTLQVEHCGFVTFAIPFLALFSQFLDRLAVLRFIFRWLLTLITVTEARWFPLILTESELLFDVVVTSHSVASTGCVPPLGLSAGSELIQRCHLEIGKLFTLEASHREKNASQIWNLAYYETSQTPEMCVPKMAAGWKVLSVWV